MCAQVDCQVLADKRCSHEPHPPSLWPVPLPESPRGLARFPLSPWSLMRLLLQGGRRGLELECETSSLPGSRGRYHHSPRRFRHVSGASAVSGPSHIFQNAFSIISWAWTFCSCCKTASKLRTIFASFARGYWDHRLPEAGTNAFLLSAGASGPSFPVKPQQCANQSRFVHFYLSRKLLFQLKKKKNHIRIKLSPSHFVSNYFLQPSSFLEAERKQLGGVRSLAQDTGGGCVPFCLASARLSVNNAAWQDSSSPLALLLTLSAPLADIILDGFK